MSSPPTSTVCRSRAEPRRERRRTAAGRARERAGGRSRRGGSRQLRQVSAVLWASFLGATATIATIIALPAGELMPPQTPHHVALLFLIAWLLAVIPALIAAVLATPVRKEDV